MLSFLPFIMLLTILINSALLVGLTTWVSLLIYPSDLFREMFLKALGVSCSFKYNIALGVDLGAKIVGKFSRYFRTLNLECCWSASYSSPMDAFVAD